MTTAKKLYVFCPATIPTTSRSAADRSHVVVVVVLLGATAAAAAAAVVQGTAAILGRNTEEEGRAFLDTVVVVFAN